MSRNQFGASCFRCGKWVPPGEGHFERIGPVQREKYGAAAIGRKWITQHAECAIEFRGTAHSITNSHLEKDAKP